MSRRFTAAARAIAALCVLAAPAAAHASPQDLFGFGPRAVAMGGTGASFTDDFGAVHANPAGLSRARQFAFTLGYSGVGYALELARGAEASQHASVQRAAGTTIGLLLPLPFGGVLRNRLAIGLGFYTPTDVIVRGRILRPETPQFLVVADRAQSVALQLGLGLELPYGLRLGAGFAALAAISGSVVISTDPTGRVGSRVDDQLIASYAPVVGASFERGWFRVGAVFRGTLVGRFGVTIEARDIGLPLPVFNIAGIAQYDPWQVALEAGFVHAGWTLALQGTFKRWSDYPGPLERTTAGSPAPPSPGFHDTVVVRAGGEYRWQIRTTHVAVRAGYFYEPTPAPPATGFANYLDNDRHVATLGVGVGGQLARTHFSLDVFAQAHFLPPRTSTKDPNANVPPDNPGLPSLTSGGSFYLFGLAATVTF